MLEASYRFTSGQQSELVLAALELADGRHDASAIAGHLADRDLGALEQCEALVRDLIRLGVLVSSRTLAEEFHQASSNPAPLGHSITTDEILSHQQWAPALGAAGAEFSLPQPSPAGLWELTDSRHSTRQFVEDSVDPAQLSQLLACAYGPQRPVASAGDLRPLLLSVVLPRPIGSIEAGVHRYDPQSHGLRSVSPWSASSRSGLEFTLDSSTCLGGSPAIVVIAADVGRHPYKYGARGYRYTLFEVGEVTQSLTLAAEEAALGSLVYGGFKDSELAKFLELPDGQMPLLVVALGGPSPNPVETDDQFAFRLEHELVGTTGPVTSLNISEPWPAELRTVLAVTEFAAREQERDDSSSSRICGGTGTTATVATIKAIAEAFERHSSGLINIDVTSTAGDLPGRWLDPREYVPYSPEQYERLDYLVPFDEAETLQWVLGHDAAGEDVYVPADLVYYPFYASGFGRRNLYYAHSSGVAAHVTREAAMEGAALELIERDCLVRTWLNRLAHGRVDPNVLDGHMAAQAEYVRDLGYDVVLLDASEHGAAVAMVLAISESTQPAVALGVAAHSTSWLAAAEKGMHEMVIATSVRTFADIAAEEVRTGDDHTDYWSSGDRLQLLEFLLEGPEIELPPDRPGPDLGELDMTVVSLTPRSGARPLEVVRTLSPKLVPLHFGFGTEHYTHPAITADYIYPGLPHPFA